MAAEAGTAFVAIQGDFAPLGKSLRARGGIMVREGTKMGGAIGAGIAVAAGAAFTKAVGQALDIGKANDVLSAQLGATGKDSKRLGKMAGDLYAGAYGDSIESVNDAVRSVHQNIGRGSEKDLKRFARNSLNLAQTFGTQADEVTRSVNALVSNGLAKNVDEAFNLITVGFQNGADKGGEFLDTLNEYSEPVKSLGLSARDFTAALVSGADNGVYSVDKIGDAVKEFSIRAVDGSKTTKDAFKTLGLDADTYAQRIAAGGPTARKATGEIIQALGRIKDPVKREAAGVGLFGSMFEDVGFKAIKGLDPASQALGKTSDAADKLDKTLSGNAKTSIEQFKRTALQGLANEAEQHVIPKLEELFGILNDPKLTADQKFDKVLDGIADEVEKAAPIIADRAAEIAPKVARAFVNSFVDAGPWGQLLIGGALLNKMGGLSAFAALGRKTGAAYRGGFGPASAPPVTGAPVAGAPVTPAGQPSRSAAGGSNAAAAATGAAGGAAAVRGAAGNMLRSAGASAAPVVVGLAGFKAVTESIKGASASDLGLLDQYATKLERVAKTGDAPGMRALAGKLRETANATSDITKGKTLEGFATALDQAARSGGEDLGALKAAAASMDKSVGGNLEHLRGELGKLPNRSQAVDDAISRMSRSSSKSIGSMRTNVALNTRLIANKLGADTAEGKDALQRNFRAAATSIKHAMDDGKISADQGLAEIRKLMTEALGFYGITPAQAKRSRINSKGQMTADTLTGKSNQTIGGHQRGGPIDIGKATGDSVPALLERGEYVLNREAVKSVGKRALDRINFGAAPRFQTGGIVELLHPFNDPEGHGGSNSHLHIAMKTHAAIVALGKKLQAAGWRVSENPAFGGVGGMHAPGGYHYTGQAIDVNWPNAADEGRKIKEVLAQLDAGNISGGGGAVAAQAEKLKRVLAEGLPSSPIKDVVQGGLDMVRSGAQKVLDDAAANAGGALEGAEPSPGHGAATREQMVGWAKTALRRTAIYPPTMENVEKILTLAKKESGWIVDSMNNWDSNAKAGNPSGGLMHITIDKVGGSMARLHDPVDNMSESIRYQDKRYGRLVTFSPYRLGGLVEMLQQGGQVQGLEKGGEPKTKKPIVDTIAQLREGAQLRLPDRPGKKTSRNGRMTKRGWRPSGYKNKVKDVTSASRFQQLVGELEQDDDRYSALERIQDLTEENSTKQVPVQDATDQELIGHGLDWQEIARLRAEPEQMIELLNPPDIQHRVGELDALINLKNDIATKLAAQQQAGTTALQKFAEGIAERVARAQSIRERVADNIRKIKALQDRADELDEREKNTKGEKAKKAFRKRFAPERKRIGRQLDTLRDETNTLVGARKLEDIAANVKSADGGGGMLKSTVSSLGKWTEDRDALAPNTAGLPKAIQDTLIDVEYLRKERREWLETAPPKIDVPVPAEPETTKADDDGRLKELLEEWKRNQNLRGAVGDAQKSILAGAADLFPNLPFAGVFHQGGIVPGPRGSEQVAVVQGGEVITALDDVARAGGSIPQVHINVAPGMEWLSQFIDARVENATRTQARRAGRGLPGGAF